MRGTFAGSADAIVASDAVAHKTGVIYSGWYPLAGAVTAIAFRGGGDMRCRFTCRNDVVMATGTDANHLRMVDSTGRNRCPVGG